MKHRKTDIVMNQSYPDSEKTLNDLTFKNVSHNHHTYIRKTFNCESMTEYYNDDTD